MKSKDVREIKDYLRGKNYDETTYRSIIQKLYAKNKTFQ